MHGNQNWIANLVHLYVDGALTRRELVRRVARKTGGVAAAMVALESYEELRAETNPVVPAGVRVAEDDPEIDARDITFAGADSMLYGYLTIPKTAYKELQPGVLVVHENRGLVEHIKDVTRRVAKAGFIGLAVDLLSRQGGAASITDPAQQMAAYNRTNQWDRRLDLLSGLDYLKHMDWIVFDRIGMVGFCAGGGNTWNFAAYIPELAAAVPFYGPPPEPEDVVKIKTPVLAIYGERDRTLTQRILPVADAMNKAQQTFGLMVYEGAGHAFHNDTGPNYEAASAKDAWGRTIAYFDKWLRRPR